MDKPIRLIKMCGGYTLFEQEMVKQSPKDFFPLGISYSLLEI